MSMGTGTGASSGGGTLSIRVAVPARIRRDRRGLCAAAPHTSAQALLYATRAVAYAQGRGESGAGGARARRREATHVVLEPLAAEHVREEPCGVLHADTTLLVHLQTRTSL